VTTTTATKTTAAVEIEGVTRSFGKFVAVDNLDLVVPEGSMCGFLGPNGAGKTTTIRMIMAIIFPDTGRISVLGKNSALDSRDRIGYLPEERGVYRKMKSMDFLMYMARLKGVDGAAAKKKAIEWLERVELPEVRKKKLEELSKGMQQKVQLAGTMIHDPDFIILDEPFSGLDPVNARLLRDLILRLHSEEGRTFIFSTHVLHQAEQICERIFLIDRGKKILDATMEEIREQFDPRTILVRLGDDPVDLTQFEGVRQVESLNGEKEVHLHQDTDPNEVMRAMLDAGDLRKVELRQPTLDDVFISLVDDARRNEFGDLEVGDHE
jgi:ABC-2 type transport system ATP-binding protein